MQDLLACVIRVCNAAGETLGTGFVVTENLAVTCAHVVAACGSAPGGNVRVVFHANGEACEAEVLPEFWRAPDADDVAVLRLLPQGAPLPADVVAAKLGMTRGCDGHAMRTAGYAELSGGYEFAWAEGKIRGVVPHPKKQVMLQMDAAPIRRGMSGAPVFDLDTQRVVGIVNEFMLIAPLEWATTSETLSAICPELKLHPPQAVEDYLAAMRDYCANLPYLTLHDIRPPKTLDEVYVPLKARPQLRKDAEQDEESGTREVLHPESLSITEVMQKSEHAHVLILGEPGAGKSTLLRQLAERAWDAPERIGVDAPHLPILVPLRRMAGVHGSLEERLNRAVTGELVLTRQLPDGFFTDWPVQTDTRWLILLDALDEVPPDERSRLMQWLRGLLKNVGHNRIVITSRPAGYSQGELDEKVLGHYDLLPFTRRQTGEFAYRWFGKRDSNFLLELERVRAGDLRGTPLLLTIAAKVFLEKDTLPERRLDLYEQFTDIWLGEAERHGLKAELGERVCSIAKFTLAQLALAMTEHPSWLSEAVCSQVAADHLHDMLHLSNEESEVIGNRFVKVMARRSGVFARRGDVYDWIHPTFREYLAVVALVRECRQDWEQAWQRGVSNWKDKNWREVALMTLGLLSDKGVDVTPFVKRVHKSGREGLYFAGAALADQINVDTGVSDTIIDDLLREARARDDWLLANNPIAILGELHGNRRVANGLLALARDGRVHIMSRVRVPEALSRLGFVDEAEQARLALARDEKMWAEVTIQTVEMLRRMKHIDDLLMLAHEDRVMARVRLSAVEVLEHLKRDDESLQARLAQARDAHIEAMVPQEASEFFRQLRRNDEVIFILLALARDGKIDLWVRERATEALGRLGRPDDVLSLALDGQVWPRVRKRAAEVLGERGCPDEAAKAWLALALDKGVWPEVRERAAEAAGRHGQIDKAIPILLALADDEAVEAWVRKRAAESLGRLGYNDEAFAILLAMACDERTHFWEREGAVESLGQLADSRVLPGLESIAQKDQNQLMRQVARRAVEQICQRMEER